MGKRDGGILLLAIALTVLGVVRVFVDSAVQTGAWGLSFRQEGTAPIGNAGADQLRQFDAVYLGDTRQKRLYLTFDAGYENGATEKILDTLKAHNTKAAFFLVGNYIDRNRDLVRRMVEDGHIVGNHTMHHYDMLSHVKSVDFPRTNHPAVYEWCIFDYNQSTSFCVHLIHCRMTIIYLPESSSSIIFNFSTSCISFFPVPFPPRSEYGLYKTMKLSYSSRVISPRAT